VARILRAADACESAAFDAALEAWLKEPMAPATGPRLLLLGSTPPDERLHAAVEAGGGQVVAEIGDQALTRLGPPIEAGTDALAALARRHHELDFGPRAVRDYPAMLRTRIAACRADGVVVWLIDQDESLAWDVPAMKRALAEAHVPALYLTRRQWDAGDGAGEEIARFTMQRAAAS